MAFLVRFNTIFGATIAVTKDLPDVEGDKLEGIETFTTRLGVAKVARAATAVLFLNYCGAVATALCSAPGAYRRTFMALAHSGLGLWLLASYRKLLRHEFGSDVCHPIACVEPQRFSQQTHFRASVY